MYKNVYNDINPELFDCNDYLKSEKYFLTSLSMDYNNDNAQLLSSELRDYYEAEYNHNQALTIDLNDAVCQTNFAWFLISKRHECGEVLSRSRKAFQLAPNLSYAHYVEAALLIKINIFDESLNEYQLYLKFNESDAQLPFITQLKAQNK